MFGVLAKRLFGSANDRYLKGLTSSVAAINALEPKLQELSDEALRGRTAELRGRLAQGESLDDILADAFATVREAAKRTLGQRHYDVQLIAIGRASCRERVCRVRVDLGGRRIIKKKKTSKTT